MSKAKLFSDFPPVSGEEWRKKIEIDLKGADFDRKLVWKTDEGFDLQPYYRMEDVDAISSELSSNHVPVFRKSSGLKDNDWLIRQDFKILSPPAECNERIRNSVSRGVQSIGLDLSDLEEVNESWLAEILDGINLEQVSLNFSAVKDPGKLFNAILAHLKNKDSKLESLKGNLGADPLGNMAGRGKANDDIIGDLAGIIREASEKTPEFKILSINAGLFQDAGSSLSQELGFGLSMANHYVKELSEKGLAPEMIANAISFSFACGPDYFLEIAKLRAARWLWTAICSEWGVNQAQLKIFIHSRSATWNLTLYDPHVNMLRTTSEAMSGSLGGSDEISVHPYDMLFREENALSSRVARNTQIILKEESYFNKVVDPSYGSYYIESLTTTIAEKAWTSFLEIEEKGGFLELLKSNFLQEKVQESMALKREKASSRKQGILGVTQYPNFTEMILGNLSLEEKRELPENSDFMPLRPFRIAEEIENLRLRTERSGKRPVVFLLKYGDPTWMTARAMFSGNFFAAAGYSIVDKPGFTSIEAGIKEAQKAKADIVVLCSSDDQYAVIGPQAKNLLGKKTELVIAGYPADSIEELNEKGIVHFIHIKTNLLKALTEFHSILQIR